MRVSVRNVLARRLQGPALFMLVLLAIEFLDEFVFGASEAAWPMIRQDLGLSYDQIGLLLSLPPVLGNMAEIVLGILGDTWRRRAIILGGGVSFVLALLATSLAPSFGLLLLGFVLFNPSSGAFVSLSQSTLMDLDPDRHEHNMARWTFAGSVGVLVGAITLAGIVALGGNWRLFFLLAALLALLLLALAWRSPFPRPAPTADVPIRATLRAGLSNALRALRRREVLRWLVLLQFSDLLLDVLYSYLALYFVDVAGVHEADAALAVTIWTGAGLVGDFLLIPLLERVRGLVFLRFATALELLLYPAFLLLPDLPAKLVVLALLGFFNTGSYAILAGHMYSSMPGQSGTVLTVGNLFGMVGSLLPLGVGLAAERLGLPVAMWLLLLGPVVLLIGLPRRANGR